MKITYETLREFARENGDVKLYAPDRGELVILKDGTPGLFDIIQKATTFMFAGREYSRDQFADLMKKSK